MNKTEVSSFKDFYLKEQKLGKTQNLNLKLDQYNKKLIEVEKFGRFREIKINAIIAIENNSELLKSQIISHIRSIEGIDVVDINETYFRQKFYLTKISIKIDLEPFGHIGLINILTMVKRQAERIDGVKKFQFISRAQDISGDNRKYYK